MNSYKGERVWIKDKLDISWIATKGKGCGSKTNLIYHEQLPRERVWIKDNLDISWTGTKGKGCGSKTNLIYDEQLPRGNGMGKRQTWYIMNSYKGERVWIKDKLDISWTATKGKGYGSKTNLIYHEQLPRGKGMDQRQTWYIMNSYQGERVWIWIKGKLDISWIATEGKGYW